MTEVTTENRPLCHGEDIAEGMARGFPLAPGSRRKVFVLRKDGELHAWLDACPHYAGGTPMAWKTHEYLNADRTRIVCASHGALFDPKTGECTLGPCLGQSLTRVEIVIGTDGIVRLADE